jgi:plasmid stabilization system protein ParE
VTYRVTIVSAAKQQMTSQALWWSEHRSVEQATRWLAGLDTALQSLQSYPERCGLARESDVFDVDLCELRYGLSKKPTHRAIFEIRGDEVIVYAIRHVAQRDFEPGDI